MSCLRMHDSYGRYYIEISRRRDFYNSMIQSAVFSEVAAPQMMALEDRLERPTVQLLCLDSPHNLLLREALCLILAHQLDIQS